MAVDAVVINSILSGAGVVCSGAVVEHCDLSSPTIIYHIGQNSMVSGLRGLVGAVNATAATAGGGGGGGGACTRTWRAASHTEL